MQGNDPLATLLFQIASPAHIPWGDLRWQELLHGYDVWVHLEEDPTSSPILHRACQSMVKHAALSSNLAALSLHVTRMLHKLVRDIQSTANICNIGEDGHAAAGEKDDDDDDNAIANTSGFSARIARVGKARATAGALRLLQLLVHPIVVQSSAKNCAPVAPVTLEDALLYRTRGDLPCDQATGRPLVYSILDLIVVTGGNGCDALETPEVYDAVVLAFQLLFVLCGTQLYQPFVSSFQMQSEETPQMHYILEELFRDDHEDETMDYRNYRIFDMSSRSTFSQSHGHGDPARRRRRLHHVWTPQKVLEACIELQIRRPPAPSQSIAHFHATMAQAAVSTRGGETLSADGMYESHLVVQATTPTASSTAYGSQSSLSHEASTSTGRADSLTSHRSLFGGQQLILDATKGVFVLGSSIILLPFRLMSLVFGVLASQQKHRNARNMAVSRKFHSTTSSRTRNALFLSDAILADLANCLVLLLINNYRCRENPFRQHLSKMVDNRWEHDNDQSEGVMRDPHVDEKDGNGKDDESITFGDFATSTKQVGSLSPSKLGANAPLMANFEGLFSAFGRSLHTEVGALLLYTFFQTSPAFAESLVVRSDLDTLIMPLLRTLYFASSTKTYMASDYSSRSKDPAKTSLPQLDVRNCPFRSYSALYVNVILLLLFSQDSSFGRDAFRRINVGPVLWYKERNLRSINLGSVLLLTLLRSVMFNLQRLQDVFLLSNCCAILQNLSPAVVDLHEYAAMRLTSVTVSVMKKHSKLHSTSAGESTKEQSNSATETDGYMTTPLGMYEEIARTLLGLIQHCLTSKYIERNLQLVYALVYYQADMSRIFKEKLYPSKLVDRIQLITQEAAAIILEDGGRTASRALQTLEEQVVRLQSVTEKKRKKEHADDDFTFTYQEESDPEIFFVPYVWETIVCVVTSSAIEWREEQIQVFPLLEPLEETPNVGSGPIEISETTASGYQENADELV